MRAESLIVGHPADREIALAMARTNAHRHQPLRLDGDHTGQSRQFVIRPLAARLDEIDGDVLTFSIPELRHDQPLDGVGEDEADHQDGHGKPDAEDRGRGAHGMTH